MHVIFPLYSYPSKCFLEGQLRHSAFVVRATRIMQNSPLNTADLSQQMSRGFKICFKILQHLQKCVSSRKLAILLFVSSCYCFRTGAHHWEPATTPYSCHGVFTDRSIFSLNLSRIQIPTGTSVTVVIISMD